MVYKLILPIKKMENWERQPSEFEQERHPRSDLPSKWPRWPQDSKKWQRFTADPCYGKCYGKFWYHDTVSHHQQNHLPGDCCFFCLQNLSCMRSLKACLARVLIIFGSFLKYLGRYPGHIIQSSWDQDLVLKPLGDDWGSPVTHQPTNIKGWHLLGCYYPQTHQPTGIYPLVN